MLFTHAPAIMKTENIMFVSCNIRFHNNKGGTRPKPQFEHTSCSDVAVITHLRKNADISESELELLDFAQSEGLSCKAIQTEDWWASLHRWFTPRTRYCVSIVPPHSFSLKTVWPPNLSEILPQYQWKCWTIPKRQTFVLLYFIPWISLL